MMVSHPTTLITGAGKRIGAALAHHLAARGHALVLHYHRSQTEAEALAATVRAGGTKVALVQADLADTASLATFWQNLPPCTHIIHNASRYTRDRVDSFTVADLREGNTIHAIDGATESAIRLFYFRRDGVDAEAIPYMGVERERVGRTLSWLEGQVRGPWCTGDDGFGLAELALVTALEWMQFRAVAPLAEYRNLLALMAAHAERPSLVSTRPG